MSRSAWRTPASVLPSASGPAALEFVPWTYRVEPARALPLLDLSITLKSKLLTAAGERRFDRVFRFPKAMILGYFLTVVLYFVVMVTPPRVGKVVAVIALVNGLPGTILSLALLRYDVVKALVSTYDTIFFHCVVISTLTVLMLMLKDLRILVLVQAVIATEVNIFLDANIQAVRRIAIVNSFALLSTLLVAIWTTLGLVPHMTNFVIYEVNSHRLEAQAVLANGFITTLALMFRSYYRKRPVIYDRTKGAVVECVSYRCPLILRLDQLGRPTPLTEPPSNWPKHIQQMRYSQCLPLIDAHHVWIPKAFAALVNTSRPTLVLWLARGFAWIAAALSFTISLHKFLVLKIEEWGVSTTWLLSSATADQLLVVAVVLSCVYIAACTGLYQRQLHRTLLTSFDFVFLSSQLTFIHFALADLFRWRQWCLILALTYAWSHWVLCVDAMTPVVRERIGISRRFIRCVTVTLALSTVLLSHVIIFHRVSTTLYDRALWHGRIFGQDLEFRMLSSFYSNYVTVLAWALRLMWRVWHAKPHGLVMIDGPVAYDNYLRRPKPSKPRLSIPHLRLVPTRRILGTDEEVAAANRW